MDGLWSSGNHTIKNLTRQVNKSAHHMVTIIAPQNQVTITTERHSGMLLAEIQKKA